MSAVRRAVVAGLALVSIGIVVAETLHLRQPDAVVAVGAAETLRVEIDVPGARVFVGGQPASGPVVSVARPTGSASVQLDVVARGYRATTLSLSATSPSTTRVTLEPIH